MAPRLSAPPVHVPCVAARLLLCLLLTGSSNVAAPASTVDQPSTAGLPATLAPVATLDRARLSDAYGQLPAEF